MIVLGISAYYHDSAAAIVRDGVVVNAAQEERFTRKKHDPGFPVNAGGGHGGAGARRWPGGRLVPGPHRIWSTRAQRATAEPLVRITRPPKISIMMTIGISQNFLRARRNSQSSATNDKRGS